MQKVAMVTGAARGIRAHGCTATTGLFEVVSFGPLVFLKPSSGTSRYSLLAQRGCATARETHPTPRIPG